MAFFSQAIVYKRDIDTSTKEDKHLWVASAIRGLTLVCLRGSITVNIWACVQSFVPIGGLIGLVCNILSGIPRGTLSPARLVSILLLFKCSTIHYVRFWRGDQERAYSKVNFSCSWLA